MASKKSKASKQSKAQERQERLRELQKQQKRVERRRNYLIFGATGVIALLIIGGTAWGLMRQGDSLAGIDGVEHFTELSSNHVPGNVDYAQNPPVGGDHNEVWQNCGYYTEPVENVNAVHSLEHGAVWITYSPDLPDDQVQTLQSLATQGAFVLVTPYEDLPSPIVVSSWGYQLQLDDADESRIQQFLDEFMQAGDAPEIGAPCTGGTGTPQFSG